MLVRNDIELDAAHGIKKLSPDQFPSGCSTYEMGQKRKNRLSGEQLLKEQLLKENPSRRTEHCWMTNM